MKIKYTLGDDIEREMEISDEMAKKLGLDTINLGPFSIVPVGGVVDDGPHS